MLNKVSTYILSDDIQTHAVLKMYLEELDAFLVMNTCADYNELYDSISTCENPLLIVDLSENVEAKLNFVHDLTNKNSLCRILALSDTPSVDLIVKVMRSGAKEFLPLPIIKTEFVESLNRLKDDFNNVSNNKSKCKIFSVFSNKGGIGKTSIATNLALELANVTKEKVALIDLNFQMGDVINFLDMKPTFNISYLLQNLEKLNEDFLLSTLERYKQSSLYVLADPPYFKQADNISAKQISKLLSILKETFSYIVIDAESSFDTKNLVALTESDLVFLVAVANLPALRNIQRCLDLFTKLGFEESKSQILLNRFMENDEVTVKDIEVVLAHKIYWKFPNNYFTVMSSINKGIPVCELNPESNIAKSYRDLALKLTDRIYKDSLIKKFENLLK